MKTKLWFFDYDIYVLKNSNRYYIGIAHDAEDRYNSHINGKCRSSSKLGDYKDFVLIHKWQSPNYLLASKLERFCHKIQKEIGDEAIEQLIKEMPCYTLEMKEIIHKMIPTTKQEKVLTRHLTANEILR